MDLIGKIQKALDTYDSELQDVDKQCDITESDDAVVLDEVDQPTISSCQDELLRESTYIEIDSAAIYGVSLRGRLHITDSMPCQDYHKVVTLSDGWIISTLSDGAGSAVESARGSKANCELACEMFKLLISKKGWIESHYLPTQVEWHIEAYNIFSLIQEVIRQKAEEESAEAKVFNATLLVVVSTPRGLLAAHLGDGRMGYKTKDNRWHTLMTPHKGEEANQTVFIPNEWNRKVIPAFTMSGVYLPETLVVESDEIDAFVMLSDGCEQSMWRCHAWDDASGSYLDRNEPQEAFLNPLLDDISRYKDREQLLERLTYIVREGTTSCQREKDDQTLLICMNR